MPSDEERIAKLIVIAWTNGFIAGSYQGDAGAKLQQGMKVPTCNWQIEGAWQRAPDMVIKYAARMADLAVGSTTSVEELIYSLGEHEDA